jgi:drug/metabolite transporter (DMT)-like permease
MSISAPPAGAQLSITFIVLAAAVAHATWNALGHRIEDRLAGFAVITTAGMLVAAPLLVLAPLPDRASWPFLLASAALHVGYILLLLQTYGLGDFSQVYPIARGTSPLVVTVIAAAFLAERPSLTQAAGILAICGGLVGLAIRRRRLARDERPAVAAAFATGLVIAAYTVVDGVGVRRSGSSIAYVGWLAVLYSPPVPLLAFVLRGRALLGGLRRAAVPGSVGGALTILAYGLVLYAQTRGALAPIAALRETSIVIGAVIGAVFFHERFGRGRIAATVLVVIGILLLNVS